MPVYKDKKRGTWYVSYSFKDLPTGTFKKRTKRGFETKKAAKEWESKNNGSSQQERLKEPPRKFDKTFKDVASEWEDSTESSEVSRTRHKEHFKYRLTELFTDRPLNDISTADLIEWRNGLAKTSYATNTKNATITFVKSVMTFGTMVYGIPNTSLMLKPLKKTKEEVLSERPVWTPDEFERFLNCVDEKFKIFFEFLYWTGCRRGEAIALQKKNIRGNDVYIQYSQRTQKDGLRPTKTKHCRWITMDDKLAEKVHSLLYSEGEYVFGGENGLSCSPIDDAFRAGIKKSGVKKIRIHDLRHSHATWLINNGVNIVAISKRLGHASIEQTLETYSHLLKETDATMIEIINNFRR